MAPRSTTGGGSRSGSAPVGRYDEQLSEGRSGGEEETVAGWQTFKPLFGARQRHFSSPTQFVSDWHGVASFDAESGSAGGEALCCVGPTFFGEALALAAAVVTPMTGAAIAALVALAGAVVASIVSARVLSISSITAVECGDTGDVTARVLAARIRSAHRIVGSSPQDPQEGGELHSVGSNQGGVSRGLSFLRDTDSLTHCVCGVRLLSSSHHSVRTKRDVLRLWSGER